MRIKVGVLRRLIQEVALECIQEEDIDEASPWVDNTMDAWEQGDPPTRRAVSDDVQIVSNRSSQGKQWQ